MNRFSLHPGVLTYLIPLLVLCGCESVSVRTSGEPKYQKKAGPPVHAPAHGYRKKHVYHYYPSSRVYYDIGRKLYFYMESGTWKAEVRLPYSLQINLNEAVQIEMDTVYPYQEHGKHKMKYSPGHGSKSKGKGKNKKK